MDKRDWFMTFLIISTTFILYLLHSFESLHLLIMQMLGIKRYPINTDGNLTSWLSSMSQEALDLEFSSRSTKFLRWLVIELESRLKPAYGSSHGVPTRLLVQHQEHQQLATIFNCFFSFAMLMFALLDKRHKPYTQKFKRTGDDGQQPMYSRLLMCIG